MELKTIPTSEIQPNPFQPRESIERESLKELADSMKDANVIQPIIVRRHGKGYQIIAGERRWRAAQFAGLNEIPAIVRETNDIQTMELSIIENWHRLALQPLEAEGFIANLYEEGVKTGRYKSINDMANKTGIPQHTLHQIIISSKERQELELLSMVTYNDLMVTRVLKDQPDLRKQVLKLREKGELSRDELREVSKVVSKVSEPVKKGLLELKIKPEEARIIESELTSEHEKVQAMKMIETERSPKRIVSLVRFIKEIEEQRREIEVIKEVDTGDVWLCPECKKKYHLIHRKPSGMHRFEEVVE